MDYHSPVAFLHVSPENDISTRLRPGNHIGLIVLAMAHDIGLDLRSPGQDDLASCRKTLGILDTRKRGCSHTDAIENHFRGGVYESSLDIVQSLADETHSVLVF